MQFTRAAGAIVAETRAHQLAYGRLVNHLQADTAEVESKSVSLQPAVQLSLVIWEMP